MTTPSPAAQKAAAVLMAKYAVGTFTQDDEADKGFTFERAEIASVTDIIEREMNQWQDIATVPKDETRVMLWNPEWSFPQPAKWVAYRNSGKGAWILDVGFKITNQFPTHWLHIPQIPPPPCPANS